LVIVSRTASDISDNSGGQVQQYLELCENVAEIGQQFELLLEKYGELGRCEQFSIV